MKLCVLSQQGRELKCKARVTIEDDRRELGELRLGIRACTRNSGADSSFDLSASHSHLSPSAL